MKRLFKSSGFWTAIIASIVLIIAYQITSSELIVTLIGALFGIDRGGKVIEDNIKANKGIRYNQETKLEEYINED